MEADYRRPAAGKRSAQRDKGRDRGDRRRLVQLVVSLGLFLLVYAGRGMFPVQSAAWKEQLMADANFVAAVRKFEQDLAGKEDAWNSVSRLVQAFLGKEQPEQSEPIQNLTLLSSTSGHGVAYLTELNRVEDSAHEPEPAPETSEPEPAPAIVTAVAQSYTDDGVALPKNVSLQYYELGLSETAVPVNGTVTSEFSFRNSPITGKREFHLALDIGAAEGTEIVAFADGTVRYIGEDDEFGKYLMIDHANGAATFYAHCSKLLVDKGDRVTCGQRVALVGETGKATGPHLHFTVLKDNIRLDPAYYVDLS